MAESKEEMLARIEKATAEIDAGVYITLEEMHILLNADGVETGQEYPIEPLSDDDAQRITEALYELWQSDKLTVVPWPEVRQRLDDMEDAESVKRSEALLKQIEDGEIMTTPLSELVKRLQDLDAE